MTELPGTAGYGAEQHEVIALLEWLSVTPQRDADDDALTWYRYLSSRQALVRAAEVALAVMRREVITELYEELGSYGKVAELIGLSRTGVQRAIETARAA